MDGYVAAHSTVYSLTAGTPRLLPSTVKLRFYPAGASILRRQPGLEEKQIFRATKRGGNLSMLPPRVIGYIDALAARRTGAGGGGACPVGRGYFQEGLVGVWAQGWDIKHTRYLLAEERVPATKDTHIKVREKFVEEDGEGPPWQRERKQR